MSHDTLTSILNVLLLEENSLYPPFLLSFEIFKFNVHNYLVDSNALVNVMPLFVANKINDQWGMTDAYIIELEQLDPSIFKEIREAQCNSTKWT